MKLTIKLFASFRTGRFKEEQREVSDNSTLGEVIAGLGICHNEVGMALVNGRHASMGQGLDDGHVLSLFPLLGGG